MALSSLVPTLRANATNIWCLTASLASLAVSVATFRVLFPGPAHGLYGGTALLLFFTFIAQALALLLLVALPVGLAWRQKNRSISVMAIALLLAAFFAVGAEFFQLMSLPDTGGC